MFNPIAERERLNWRVQRMMTKQPRPEKATLPPQFRRSFITLRLEHNKAYINTLEIGELDSEICYEVPKAYK